MRDETLLDAIQDALNPELILDDNTKLILKSIALPNRKKREKHFQMCVELQFDLKREDVESAFTAARTQDLDFFRVGVADTGLGCIEGDVAKTVAFRAWQMLMDSLLHQAWEYWFDTHDRASLVNRLAASGIEVSKTRTAELWDEHDQKLRMKNPEALIEYMKEVDPDQSKKSVKKAGKRTKK